MGTSQKKSAIWYFSFVIPFLLFNAPTFSQTQTLSTSLCGQAPPGSPCPGTTLVELYDFAYNITSGNPAFTGIVGWTTTGTYTATDITGFTLYVTNFCAFNTSTPLQTLPASGPGAKTFTFVDPLPAAPSQRYFWITTNIAAGAVAGRTIQINIITAAMTTITGSETFGTNTIGGLQTICNVLPIQLLTFTGEHKNRKNYINWSTISETNNDYFTLERSFDGYEFSELSVVKGAGTSNSVLDYEVIDHFPESIITYYRLKQTDFNGKVTYSEIILVKGSEEETIEIFPNPTNGIFEIKTPLNEYAKIKIINSTGAVLKEIECTDQKIDISHFAKGLYFISVETGNTMSVKKILKE